MKLKCTLANILLELKQKMYSSEDRKKIERWWGWFAGRCLAFYKQADFVPRYPLKLTYKGQPAADTGDFMRQFYSELLYKLAEKYICGNTRKVPLYNTDILMSGLMKMIIDYSVQYCSRRTWVSLLFTSSVLLSSNWKCGGSHLAPIYWRVCKSLLSWCGYKGMSVFSIQVKFT